MTPAPIYHPYLNNFLFLTALDHTFQFLSLCKLNPNEDVERQKKPNNLYWLSAQKKEKLYEEAYVPMPTSGSKKLFDLTLFS